MINLIPNEEKKKMVRGFYYRLIVVFLMAMTFGLFASIIAMTPSFFLSSVKKNLAADKLAMQKAEPVPLPDQVTLAAIDELNQKIDTIERARKNKFSVSERVVREIVLKKMPDIKIFQITYANDPTDGKEITIRGTAPNRERLLAFRRVLEDDPLFKKVDLPISNFVKGSNIQFSLSLTPS